MQYILGSEQYSDILQYYMEYAYITLESLNGKMDTSSLCDPRYNVGEVEGVIAARYFDLSTNTLRENVYSVNPHCNGGINVRHKYAARGGYKLYINRWSVLIAGIGQHGSTTISCHLSPGDNKYAVVCDDCWSNTERLYSFDCIEQSWGRFSPHLVRRTLCIEEHIWEYPCDVKFEF